MALCKALKQDETIAKYGFDQVQKVAPRPQRTSAGDKLPDDDRYPGHDLRYKDLTDREIPLTENLSETMDRVLPFWSEIIIKPVIAKIKK
jgi:2,3-bisphosphoglycerate-dependent phosphoglycerate mutase